MMVWWLRQACLRWVVLAGSGDGEYSAGFAGQNDCSVGTSEFAGVRVSVLQGFALGGAAGIPSRSADEGESFEAGPVGRFLIGGPIREVEQ